ncbi:MAG: alcohol dehydrogenase [Actinobacteria bacterium HGW-Actinobacteria-2]|nr:MAG: alcohol dehydrogenase [Actinobacteria bacterium HGW-Actinobacteria-2]
MKALYYDEFGSRDQFRFGEVADPHIGPDSLLVKVVAAGLNPVDYKVRQGHLAGLMDTMFPVVPGWDVAGVVVATGLDTPEYAVGDEVLAYARKDVVGGGTVAELVSVPVRTAAHKPAGVSFTDAAALPLAGLTALQSIRRAGVQSGQTVLIHAAAGGVGSFATQLAVLAGARVIGTASEANHDYLRSLGAEPISYGDDLVEQALALAPERFDAILDYVGGTALDSVPTLLIPGGNVASVADARAVAFGGHYVWVRPDHEDLAHLVGLVADGKLRVNLDGVYPFEKARDAYAELEGGHVRGKLVVTI